MTTTPGAATPSPFPGAGTTIPPGSGTTSGTDKQKSRPSMRFATIVALAVLIAYGVLILYLMKQTGAKEPDWDRLVYLFSGVEAVAFAAAGFLFGNEVQRRRADIAEKQRDQAQSEKEREKEKYDKATTRIDAARNLMQIKMNKADLQPTVPDLKEIDAVLSS